jgi:hypothetical protein
MMVPLPHIVDDGAPSAGPLYWFLRSGCEGFVFLEGKIVISSWRKIAISDAVFVL